MGWSGARRESSGGPGGDLERIERDTASTEMYTVALHDGRHRSLRMMGRGSGKWTVGRRIGGTCPEPTRQAHAGRAGGARVPICRRARWMMGARASWLMSITEAVLDHCG